MAGADRQRILETADQLFNTRGYRSVTMADLAGELGMSKKTLYLEFGAKAEIAEAIVEGLFARINQTIEAENLEGEEPVTSLITLVSRIKEEVSHMQPIFLKDVQKVLPDLWDRIVQFRADRILAVTQTALDKAKERGQIGSLDTKLTALIFLESVQSVIRPEFLSQHEYSIREVMDGLIEIFFRGIFSSKSMDPLQREGK